jgi:hypothetical protein
MGREVVLTREDLHKQVWQEPLSLVARRYGLSEFNLRTICIRLCIPMPRENCWKKVRAGRVLDIAPLPVEYKGVASVKLFLAISPAGEGHLLEAVFDPIVVAARDSLRKTMKDKYGVVDGLVQPMKGQMDIWVSPSMIDRACQFMDRFIKAARHREHTFKVKGKESFICIGGHELQITCREKLARVAAADSQTYYSTELKPTGILVLQLVNLFHGRDWKDGTTLSLENQIPDILDKLEGLSREIRKEELERGLQRAEGEQEERLRKDWELRREKELADFKGLLGDAGRWRQVVLLREYLEAVEQGIGISDAGLRSPEWLAWARNKADWYDPLVDADDEWLEDVDKGTLKIKVKW